MRSNSFITQRVVFALQNYLNGQLQGSRSYADTTIEVAHDDSLFININGNPIMTIVGGPNVKDVSSVLVTAGFYYDSDGNPTKITRERLNGLLDALGEKGVIPQGVRVYIDREYGVCYLKHEDTRIPMGKHYNRFVSIVPNASSFEYKLQEEVLK